MAENKRSTGSHYEEVAAEYLRNQGLQILEKNFRSRQGEIDLVALDGSYLVFVEVKYRKDGQMGAPSEAVGYQKQMKIRKVALYYLCLHHYPETAPCRFDVVGIQGETVRWIRNAF